MTYAALGTSPSCCSNHDVSIDTQRPSCVRSSSRTITGSPSTTAVSTFIVCEPADARTCSGDSGASGAPSRNELGSSLSVAPFSVDRSGSVLVSESVSGSVSVSNVSPSTGSCVSTLALGSSPIGAAGIATAAISSTAASPSGFHARAGTDTLESAPVSCGAISSAAFANSSKTRLRPPRR
ncbi:hypothetical protein DJ80_16500 [Halorubrum ezzemoulense]|uniref:Uncharacterized protein n=1 Tax=Halorubrum ezzemoulense TaxID=337243 RepID=A0A256ITR1_HALEZ|nr:hypothetical protein DJ80_16500 [Halorubrum ezzemoulense]